jgi:hypothetical protein
MATSSSIVTPATSFSTMNLEINSNEDDQNPSGLLRANLFHSLTASAAKRTRSESGIHLQTITADNRTTPATVEHGNYEDDQLLSSHYDLIRLKQEKLLIYANIFRLAVIFILGPILYFLV